MDLRIEGLGVVGLEEQGLIDDAVELVGDTSGATGSACATQLLATTICAGCSSLEALLADGLANVHLQRLMSGMDVVFG